MSNAPIHPAGSSEAFNYIAEANVTASNNYHGDAVSHHEAFGIITSSVMALNQLDKLKKALFYGRNLEDFSTGNEIRASMATWPETIKPGNASKGEFILHAIVGIATESGELLEALLQSVSRSNPNEFDEVNFVEELGDVLWYVAIGLGAIGVSFDEVQRRNIAKLRHRFPQKFTEYDANNRDLFGERKILEMQVAGTPEGYRSPMTDGEGHVIEVTSPNGYVKIGPDDMREAWECTIGSRNGVHIPPGADLPMREAVREAYTRITGEQPEAIFSGWGATFSEPQRAVIENRLPVIDKPE